MGADGAVFARRDDRVSGAEFAVETKISWIRIGPELTAERELGRLTRFGSARPMERPGSGTFIQR